MLLGKCKSARSEQSAEQAQRVQDNLQEQDQKRRELLLRQKAQRPRVERDW